LLTRGKEVLVVDHLDQHDGLVWGVVGGHIGFGERAEDAARREAMEETGFEPGELRLLSFFENIFEYAGETGHEVCFAFEADASDTVLAETDYVSGQESDGSPLLCRWVDRHEIAQGARVTWPRALRELVLKLPT
jgi:ADP-ribose pyrophosphatase YjhB (NUDIX family)